MTGARFRAARNAEAVDRGEIPRLSVDELREAAAQGREQGLRVAALFGAPAAAGCVELFLVLADDEAGTLALAAAVVEGDEYPSFTPAVPEAHAFEREIAEQWGLRPLGHPWLKPLRFTPPRRDRDVWGRSPDAWPGVGIMDFYRVAGEEVHEVAVGPVHAGVIEPGHFRFQCHGEEVYHLEISLGYQHRGVERALVGGPNKRTIHYIETLAGDSTAAHALAYCHAMESLSGCHVSARAHALRGVALELERMANHTGTLGALAGDVAFLPTASYCGRLRGDFLNLTAELCGSRFGRGLSRPGGVAFDAEPGRVRDMAARLGAALRDVDDAVGLMMASPSVQARFEETGRVEKAVAEELGLVGVSARACGLVRDVRHDFASGIFRFAQVPVSTWHTGDVFARAHVRWKEIQRSGAFVRAQIEALPQGAARTAPGPLAAHRVCVSLVEGHRGEVCHAAVTGEGGRFAVYKVVDPSFHDWMGLAMALRNQAISDFPLCNKSFDLSYCGHDL